MAKGTRLKLVWMALAVLVAAAAGLAVAYRDAMPNTVRRTSEGFWGTGTHTWRYRTGEPMRVDEVYRGRETKSRWFDRPGNLVGETNWVDGDGIAYFMRQDGTVKSKMSCRNFVAHGMTWYFKEDGTLEGTAEFSGGEFVSGYQRVPQGPEKVEEPPR